MDKRDKQKLAEVRAAADRRRVQAESKLKAATLQADQEARIQASLSRRPVGLEVGRVGPLALIAKRAPRLILPEYLPAVEHVLRHEPFVRPLESWKPRGKGRDMLFRSLCEHLLMRYRTPAFLWSGFFPFERRPPTLIPIVVQVAAGESLYKLVKKGELPVPMTKAMCHDLLTKTTSDESVLEGIRRTQVNAMGGDRRLLQAWMETEPGRTIGTVEQETFWATVLHWCAANPMLERNQIGPLTDYIRFKRDEDITFTMKGRSALALLRSMKEWHAGMQAAQRVRANQVADPRTGRVSFGFDQRVTFKHSGIKPGNFDFSNPNRGGENKWFIDEILTGKALMDEGRAMHHCVVSYASRITSGAVSIWSVVHQVSKGAERVLTIEVQNASRSIVQVRGACNRVATGTELNVVQSWAGQNGLVLSIGRW
jgi:hypothetical protein